MSLIWHGSVSVEGIVANLGSESLRFPNPVRPDDEIRLVTEPIDKRLSKSRPGIGIITTRSMLVNQKGESVMESTAKFMVRTRSS